MVIWKVRRAPSTNLGFIDGLFEESASLINVEISEDYWLADIRKVIHFYPVASP